MNIVEYLAAKEPVETKNRATVKETQTVTL